MYARESKGKEFTFGVSGLLYRSNLLMYDRQTESLWLQAKRQAVTGPMTGARLKALPSRITTWAKWKKKFPLTLVLSRETGYSREYGRDPYESYYSQRGGMFSRFFKAGPGEEEKELVAGIVIEGEAKAYPVSLVRIESELRDTLGGRQLTISYDSESDLLLIRTSKGEEIQPTVVYWFVWKGIHPETERYGK